MDNLAALPDWLPETDLYLFDRGEAQRAYLAFGCHRGGQTPDGVPLHHFVVWAPHAKSIHVVGDFNDWDEHANALNMVHPGIWAGEVAGLQDGDIYKYAVEGPDGDDAAPFPYIRRVRALFQNPHQPHFSFPSANGTHSATP